VRDGKEATANQKARNLEACIGKARGSEAFTRQAFCTEAFCTEAFHTEASRPAKRVRTGRRIVGASAVVDEAQACTTR